MEAIHKVCSDRVQLKRLDNEFAPKRKVLLNKYIELLGSNLDIIFQVQDQNNHTPLFEYIQLKLHEQYS